MSPVITIDGTSGVGKGTVSSRVAVQLNWHMLDSGSLYRLTALQAKRHDVLGDMALLIDIATHLNVDYRPSDDEMKVFLDDEEVTDQIRTEEIGAIASRIAAYPEVRQALLLRQKAFARAPGLVADGRDMGSMVFPEAELKIFLTADAEERAERRYKQLKGKGLMLISPSLSLSCKARDERDTKRSASPLRAADDAVIIDTTHIGIEQVVDQVMNLVKERFNYSGSAYFKCDY